MLPRIPSIVMRRYSTAPGMASAGTCISRSIHGPSRNPMTVSGSDAAISSQTEVRTSFCSWSWSARPTACDTRMEMPEPMPTKTQSRISSGWELVATDASAVVSQNIAGADGQRKQRRAPQHRAMGHINLCGFSVRRHSPIPPV